MLALEFEFSHQLTPLWNILKFEVYANYFLGKVVSLKLPNIEGQ